MPFEGFAQSMFSPLAKLLSLNPIVPSLTAWRARDPQAVERMLAQTGSQISDEGTSYYRRLFSSPGHVGATLGMMAGWELDAIRHDLRRLDCPLTLLVGENDRAVSPNDAVRAAALVNDAEIIRWGSYGHLAHEEAPEGFAELVLEKLPSGPV